MMTQNSYRGKELNKFLPPPKQKRQPLPFLLPLSSSMPVTNALLSQLIQVKNYNFLYCTIYARLLQP